MNNKKRQSSRWAAWLLGVCAAVTTLAAIAQTVGASCYATSCRAQDAATLGGSSYGHYSGAGYAGNTGGDCIGSGCQAGNGNTVGGTCYGDGCKAGNAWNSGGDCYGNGCTPGNGGTVNGRAYPARNTNCLLGEIYRFPTVRGAQGLTNWNTPASATTCASVGTYVNGQWTNVTINPVLPPVPAPAPVAITPLPANPWDPANLPKCPFTCQAFNPASGTCVGAPSNVC